MSIHDFFRGSDVDLQGLAAYLDGLDNDTRIAETRSFKGGEQKRLFAAAEGFRPVNLDYYVPPETGTDTQVIHYGYNNQLPGFRTFEKRMFRPAEAPDQVWGYNETWLKGVVGPGYFILRPPGDAEAYVDYYEEPPRGLPGWPKVLRNNQRLSVVVYNQTRDYMRGVSQHVSVGRAEIRGKMSFAHFMLCREA